MDNIESRGLHNWKNLFRKPTLQEYIILFLLLMFCVMGYFYSLETKICREYVASFQDYWNNLTNGTGVISSKPAYDRNIYNFTIDVVNGGNKSVDT